MKKILHIIDPLEQLNPKKDTSLALIEAGLNLSWDNDVCLASDLFLKNVAKQTVEQSAENNAFANVQTLLGMDLSQKNYDLQATQTVSLLKYDTILMRKEPPFNMNYIYATYILEKAAKLGVKVINDARALRDFNEKLHVFDYAKYMPETLVSQNLNVLNDFISERDKTIVKPLDGMGGEGVHLLKKNDPSNEAILKKISNHFKQAVMLQEYLSEIVEGDKRVLVLNGEVLQTALARIPLKGNIKANLAAGGRGELYQLKSKELQMCQSIAQDFVKKGLYFVGMDMIGNKITEINITCPTCLREIQAAYPDRDLAKEFLVNAAG